MASWSMALYGSMLLTVAVVVIVVIVVVGLVRGLVGLLDTVAEVVRMLFWRLMKDLFIRLLESPY